MSHRRNFLIAAGFERPAAYERVRAEEARAVVAPVVAPVVAVSA